MTITYGHMSILNDAHLLIDLNLDFITNIKLYVYTLVVEQSDHADKEERLSDSKRINKFSKFMNKKY